jgi:8-oxo-dGTP pyrophosphatase MutT (NUDIX family)
MTQMYVVFMLNRRVTFYQSATEKKPSTSGALTYWNPDKKTLKNLTKVLKATPTLREVEIYSDNIEKLWMNYCMNYFEVVSAGGLVVNQRGNALWIFRNGHWDLPKGKVERGEKLEEAAIREVTEETGIDRIRIIGDLTTTYHTYEIDGVVHLKTTFWYAMEHAAGDSKGVPQSIEGITEVVWMKLPVSDKVWSSSFGSIRLVIESAMTKIGLKG